MEVKFVRWVMGGGVQTHFRMKPNSVEVRLRFEFSWGCDNSILVVSVVDKSELI